MKDPSTKWRAIIIIGFFAASSIYGFGADDDSRTSSVPLTHKLAREATGYRDLNAMASAIGIDYPVLVERALKKERGAVFLLLWMAGNAPLDGAGAEGYTYTMFRTAKSIGDEILSAAARKLDDGSRRAVREAFLFEYGGGDDPEEASIATAKAFPKLWGVLRKNDGEQDGAEQPATAPESKPEGKEKSKPESEGRSQ